MLLLFITLVGVPGGFIADFYSVDGPSCGFIGMPMTFALLFGMGIFCRMVFDSFFGRRESP